MFEKAVFTSLNEIKNKQSEYLIDTSDFKDKFNEETTMVCENTINELWNLKSVCDLANNTEDYTLIWDILEYRVKKWENLWEIIKNIYWCNFWGQIKNIIPFVIKNNPNIKNPDHISIGQKIYFKVLNWSDVTERLWSKSDELKQLNWEKQRNKVLQDIENQRKRLREEQNNRNGWYKAVL